MDTQRAITILFDGWDDEEIDIQPESNSVRIGLGVDLIDTAPANGGNAASNILHTIATHRGLSVSTADGGTPTWKYLLAGNDLLVTPVRGWAWVQTDDLPDSVTVAQLAEATGLTRNTVRDQLRVWTTNGLLKPLPGFGANGALSYPLGVVRALAAGMPGSGNRRG